jgi:hypothetical protein
MAFLPNHPDIGVYRIRVVALTVNATSDFMRSDLLAIKNQAPMDFKAILSKSKIFEVQPKRKKDLEFGPRVVDAFIWPNNVNLGDCSENIESLSGELTVPCRVLPVPGRTVARWFPTWWRPKMLRINFEIQR